MSGSARYSSGVTPRISSIWGFTYSVTSAVVRVHDGGDLLDEAAVARLGFDERRGGLSPGEQLAGVPHR